MIRRHLRAHDHHRRAGARGSGLAAHCRGAALVEYTLLLMVFVLGVVYSLEMIDEEIKEDSSSTAHRIGGVVELTSTTVAPSTTAGSTTTMPVNRAPTVYAGPDRTIRPSNSTWTLQQGTVADSDTPPGLLDATWSSSQASLLQLRNAVHNGGNISVELGGTRPGTYTLTATASDGYLTSSDTAQVKITSGIARFTEFTVTGDWDDWQKTRWDAWVDVRVRNEFDQPVAGVVVSGRWTLSNGSRYNGSCTTNTGGRCTIRRNDLPASITSACFQSTGMSGPAGCFDGWDGSHRSGCVYSNTIWAPPPPTTTTAGPTTTAGATTTTTRASTTTQATTTTRPTTTTRATTTTIAL